MSGGDGVVRLGTRASPLAMWQAQWVRDRLQEHDPNLRVDLVEISSAGDTDLVTPLAQMGEVGIFTKTLEAALVAERIDIAVHSLKDVPAQLVAGTSLAGVSPREDPRDAWFARDGLSLEELPAGAKVATGSLRRRCQLLRRRPDLELVPLRGNLNTRWRKFEEGRFDAMILAVAGVLRLGWGERMTSVLETDVMLPAVGQGIVGMQTRIDGPAAELAAVISHGPTAVRARAERSLLEAVAGGCVVPLAGYCEWSEDRLWLRARLGPPDGSRLLVAEAFGEPEQAEELGRVVAEEILQQGGAEIIHQAKRKARQPR